MCIRLRDKLLKSYYFLYRNTIGYFTVIVHYIAFVYYFHSFIYSWGKYYLRYIIKHKKKPEKWVY